MTFLYEIRDIRRFPKVGDFLFVREAGERNQLLGRKTVQADVGAKIGNPHLKWGFSEAITLLKREVPGSQNIRRVTH